MLLPRVLLHAVKLAAQSANVRRSFHQRAETFGFESQEPWALHALDLIFRVPRAYQPLVGAWEKRHSEVLEALERLVSGGWVAYQPPVLVDSRSGELTAHSGKRLDRYVTTRSGRQLATSAKEDSRAIEDRWAKVAPGNATKIAALLNAFDVRGSHLKYGVSGPQAIELSGLADRTGRWWVNKLVADGLLRQLEGKTADQREVIPGHWRPTRMLAQQLHDVFAAYTRWAHLTGSWRLQRTRYLTNIDPARVGISGATDYDHDVVAQQVLGAMLASPRVVKAAAFDVEPRIALGVTPVAQVYGAALLFNLPGSDIALYQPDGIIVERTDDNKVRRSIVEYERHQSRRDGWLHLERFCGYVVQRRLPFEPVALRFVVDSASRLRAYIELIEAFCDYLTDNPDLAPPNQVVLCAASVQKVVASADALDDRCWHRLELPQGNGNCLLHQRESSPYDLYFSRKDI